MVDSQYEGSDLRAVRPYLIVGDANSAIHFYEAVFDAVGLERHSTPEGAVGHAKLAIGDTIIEIGQHPDAPREPEALPRIGLRLYVADTDATHARAIAAGATGEEPSERPPGTRRATVVDPWGLTWWLAAAI